MSSPPLPDPDTPSADGLKRLVARLLARVAALEAENRRLREENARLKDLPKRPKLAPGGMDRATGRAEARRRGRRNRGGRRTPPATEERVLTVAAPPGSRRKGYQPYTVQDLVLAPRVVRYRRERWVTPDGREIVAPLPPEVAGHFGPGIVRFALMQHVQGQARSPPSACWPSSRPWGSASPRAGSSPGWPRARTPSTPRPTRSSRPAWRPRAG